MSKLRIALLTLAVGAIAAASVPSASGIVAYEAGTERVVRAGFHLGDEANRTEVALEAVTADLIGGAGLGSPVQYSSSQACLTVDPAGSAPEQTFCGPATVELNPTLDKATVIGVINNIEFSLEFVATQAPAPSVSLPTSSAASVGFSRAGSAAATFVGGLIGEAETQGSSWYAEAKEKTKTSADPQ